MYKYQCSKKECGKTWTLEEGCLNGFTLTCPVCGKGRGIFVEQIKPGVPADENRSRTQNKVTNQGK